MTPTTPPAIPSDIPAEVWAEAEVATLGRSYGRMITVSQVLRVTSVARALLAAQERGKLMERERWSTRITEQAVEADRSANADTEDRDGPDAELLLHAQLLRQIVSALGGN